ncbi:hypothetical protein V8E52_008623 [Russula decolorans]
MSESGIHTNTTTTWKCLRLSGYSTSERAAMTMVTARAESAIEPCRSAVVLLENLLDAVEPANPKIIGLAMEDCERVPINLMGEQQGADDMPAGVTDSRFDGVQARGVRLKYGSRRRGQHSISTAFSVMRHRGQHPAYLDPPTISVDSDLLPDGVWGPNARWLLLREPFTVRRTWLCTAPGSSIGGAASGASSIPMVKHSSGHRPHTDMDVGDALPWVGRARGHDVSIESRWCKLGQDTAPSMRHALISGESSRSQRRAVHIAASGWPRGTPTFRQAYHGQDRAKTLRGGFDNSGAC